MKSFLNKISALIFGVFFLAGTAMAASIEFKDIDIIGADISLEDSYTGTFNIADGDGDLGDIWGYDPLLHILESASVKFTFFHGQDDGHAVSINFSDQSAGFGLIGPNQGSYGKNFPDNTTDLGFWTDLSMDGVIQYSVIGRFIDHTLFNPEPNLKLVSAELIVQAREREAVPEPSTILLFGFAIMGLAVSRKRFMKK